jgi:hypothetical protein
VVLIVVWVVADAELDCRKLDNVVGLVGHDDMGEVVVMVWVGVLVMVVMCEGIMSACAAATLAMSEI